MPTTAIFVRSYPKDFQWLNYCVQSIDTFCRGFMETVIAVPLGTGEFIKRHYPQCRTVEVPDEPGLGYLDQQATKMNADRYTAADYILFTDSDALFTRHTTPNSFRTPEGKILHLMTPWEQVGDAQCWKEPVRKALGFVGECEMMRRFPFTFPREVTCACRVHIERVHGDVRNYILKQKAFSEFNTLGTYAHRHAPGKFDFQNTQNVKELPPVHVRQFWSWGGITPEVMKEIKGILCIP